MADKKMVKFWWNDQEIEAEEGSNLLQAALGKDIEVAHYCYHPGLSIAGVCRMCMIEQEGVPRIFPACNAVVQEGIKVSNNTPRIKDAVEWALQLHLVNHPLDCTICDQAGECGLQDYYMEHGGYDSSMTDQKVHKKKVQDIGKNVMLDAERCILCTRCVRFSDEVTKTSELGIVNRGDHAEITAYKNLENDYAQNLVDICPVGALTSKDFRFKQRVWLLDDVETTCIGCETGCSVKISQNEKGSFRVKPVQDEEVNGHWMCDDGREIYKHTSAADRLQGPLTKTTDNMFVPVQESEIWDKAQGKTIRFILHSSLCNEEYAAFFEQLPAGKEVAFYELPSQGEAFDGVLKRSNKNANSKGAAAFAEKTIPLDQLLKNQSDNDVIMVAFPEFFYSEDHVQMLSDQLKGIKIGLVSNEGYNFLSGLDYLLPVPTFLEKTGTVTNFQGTKRNLKAGRHYGFAEKTIVDYVKKVSEL